MKTYQLHLEEDEFIELINMLEHSILNTRSNELSRERKSAGYRLVEKVNRLVGPRTKKQYMQRVCSCGKKLNISSFYQSDNPLVCKGPFFKRGKCGYRWFWLENGTTCAPPLCGGGQM